MRHPDTRRMKFLSEIFLVHRDEFGLSSMSLLVRPEVSNR